MLQLNESAHDERELKWGQPVDELIRWASELHAASGVANAVLEKTADPNFVISHVVSLIERDPALTARILAAVNSSRYGMSRRISNLQQAVALLGQKTLRTIALSFSVLKAFSADIDERIHREFWRRSLTTSLIADRLSRRCKDVDPDDAYISGLLADIGMLALLQFKPDTYLPLCEAHSHGPKLVAAERAALGCDHAEFGARLLELWQFPAVLSQTVAVHHSEDAAATATLARFVLAGNQLPSAIWLTEESAIQSAFSYFERFFNFDFEQFIELAIAVNQAVAHEAQLFDIGGLDAVSDEVLQVIRERYRLAASVK